MSLGDYRELDGVPLIVGVGDWRLSGGILVTTTHAFQGLDADIVMVYGLNTFGALFTRADLYVAWTRVRHRILVVCHGGEARAMVEDALAVRSARGVEESAR